VRLATNPLVVQQPATIRAACSQVREWISVDIAWVPSPTDRHAELIGEFCQHGWMTSRLVPDAHLAALAIEHGLTLCSTDGDFARFAGLSWLNPLAAAR
jgi:toxin-antitoxin system PIN domain toxin